MTKIPIAEGKRLSEKYKAPVVIVFTILDGGDTINVMTYGQSKALCRHAGDLGKKITEKVLDGTIVPEQTEPLDLPDEATNWRGRQRERLISSALERKRALEKQE
ncbi:MAG TPA: hypothetical protein VG815_18125 [Chloroflexota bacterium]|jgi:hypothetical protein|nr:hypothetical protein [Chloroflexota bacterium]